LELDSIEISLTKLSHAAIDLDLWDSRFSRAISWLFVGI
jgi:hypothetical protein